MSRYTVERENMEAERANLNWQVEQGIIYGYRVQGNEVTVFWEGKEVKA